MSTATPSLSDARLARRAVHGSSRAFEAIFKRYHQDLYRYCAAIVGNSADAQDAVQNTMMKVLQALPGEQRRIELKPWLYRIAHNEAIEIVRRRLPAEAIDADSLLGPANAAEQVEVRDRLRQLVADVAELPERQRGALVMRELGGLSFEEIGAALGTSVATARQTLYEARLGLRAMVEGREMDCDAAMRAISDGDRRLLRGRKLRAHLRACEDCRDFRAAIAGRRADLALLAPLPAVASAGILHGVLGGAAAGKSLLGATAVKTMATLGVVAAVGVTAADRGGLIHLGPGQAVAPPPAKSAPPSAGSMPSQAAGRADRSGPAAAAAPARTAVAGAAAIGTGRALAGRNPAGGRADAAPQPQRAAPEPVEPAAAEAPPPAATTHTDSGRHLGQTKHTERGDAAVGGAASPGKSALAPGQTKPAHSQPAAPAPAHAKPKPKPKPKPEHAKAPAAHAAPGQAKKSQPEATVTAPAADHPAPQPTPEESQATAEPAAAAHGKGAGEEPLDEGR